MSDDEPIDDERSEWWRSFYDEAFADAVLMNDDAAEAQAAFLVEALELERGARVFDQCCGTGRLVLPLARRGLDVVGADLAEAYVARARERAGAEGLACDLRVADAFTHVVDPPCDGAFNWHTSFGYARDDAKNVEMLRRAYESLRPGGRFALDFPNVAGVMRGFQGAIVQRATVEQGTGAQGELLVVRESTLRLDEGLLDQRWTYVSPSGARHERRGATRLYLPHELRRLTEEAGFVDVRTFGDLDSSPVTLASPRSVVLARRPA